MKLILFLALFAQDVPAEHVEAERAARKALEILGLRTDKVSVEYTRLGKNVYGDHSGNRVRINTDHLRSNVETHYHEFWHHYQQERLGRFRFNMDYDRFEYKRNPFEKEARLVESVLAHEHRMANSWVAKHLLRNKATFEERVPRALDRALPKMRRMYRGKGVQPAHLDALESRLRQLNPVPPNPNSGRLAREAGGLAQFAGAYLLKEGIKAVETGDLDQMAEAAGQMKTGRFWADVGIFSVASRAVEKLPIKGLSRAALPLAAGMAAVQLAHGEASVKDIAIGTGSYLAAGLAVSAVADTFLYPVLFAAGPPGWIAAGLYSVGKLAVTLYLGEKLEHWIRGLLSSDSGKRATGRQGVKQKIDGLRGDE